MLDPYIVPPGKQPHGYTKNKTSNGIDLSEVIRVYFELYSWYVNTCLMQRTS